MFKTPYPIDPLQDPHRKPLPDDFTDIPAGDTLHAAEAPHHRMPRLYHTPCTGMPYDLPEELCFLTGDMPMLYDLWGLWS